MGMNFYDSQGNHVGKQCCVGNGQTGFIFSKKVVIFPGSHETVQNEFGQVFTSTEFERMIESCVVISEQAGNFC